MGKKHKKPKRNELQRPLSQGSSSSTPENAFSHECDLSQAQNVEINISSKKRKFEEIENEVIKESYDQIKEEVIGESLSSNETITKIQVNNENNKSDKFVNCPYHPKQEILVLGEANFSWTCGLIRNWINWKGVISEEEKKELGKNVIATCFEEEAIWKESFKDHLLNIDFLLEHGVGVFFGVDATLINLPQEFDGDAKKRFDRILFHFPHSGSEFDGNNYQKSILSNQALLRNIFSSCISRVKRPKGQLHITLKVTQPYASWNIVDQARKENNKFKIKHCYDFISSLYPGYVHTKTNLFRQVVEEIQSIEMTEKRATQTEIDGKSVTYAFGIQNGKEVNWESICKQSKVLSKMMEKKNNHNPLPTGNKKKKILPNPSKKNKQKKKKKS